MKNSHFFPKNTFVHFKFMREGFQVMLYGLMMKGKNCKVYDGKWSRTTMVSLREERARVARYPAENGRDKPWLILIYIIFLLIANLYFQYINLCIQNILNRKT